MRSKRMRGGQGRETDTVRRERKERHHGFIEWGYRSQELIKDTEGRLGAIKVSMRNKGAKKDRSRFSEPLTCPVPTSGAQEQEEGLLKVWDSIFCLSPSPFFF